MTFSYGGLEELGFPLLYRSNSLVTLLNCRKVNADFSVTLPALTEAVSCPRGLSATSSNMATNTVFLALQFTIVQTAGTNWNQVGDSIVTICIPYLDLFSLSKFLKSF